MENRFLEEAIKEAKIGKELGEIPVGAVIVVNNKVVGRGYNMRETKHSAISHAEIIAIENACKNLGNWRLKNAQLYVTLEPCLMCLGAIFNARIDSVYFGAQDTADSRLYDTYFKDGYANHRLKNYVDLHNQECIELLKNFFSNKRKS